MAANQWKTHIDEVRQALLVAQETKALASAIRALDRYEKWGEKWESESDGIIASFEFFITNIDVIPSSYRYAAWIDMPQSHLDEIKKTMRLFEVDVEPMYAEIHQEQVPEQEIAQAALF